MEISDDEQKTLKELIAQNQNVFLLIIAFLFSPIVIGVRYCPSKLGKLEDKRFIICIKTAVFVLYGLYLRELLDHVAYVFIAVTALLYLAYKFYMLSLECEENISE